MSLTMGESGRAIVPAVMGLGIAGLLRSYGSNPVQRGHEHLHAEVALDSDLRAMAPMQRKKAINAYLRILLSENDFRETLIEALQAHVNKRMSKRERG